MNAREKKVFAIAKTLFVMHSHPYLRGLKERRVLRDFLSCPSWTGKLTQDITINAKLLRIACFVKIYRQKPSISEPDRLEIKLVVKSKA
jgi:hypothetical protein